jgi:methylated-DNA-protein-cysteine methyltransferase-like protein
MQRAMLEDEGIEFDPRGRIDLGRYRWHPPDAVIERALAVFKAELDPES